MKPDAVMRNAELMQPSCSVSGVQFMWDCCCESMKKIQKSQGSGCILAHCMGLGKTLQVRTRAQQMFLSR